MRRHRKPLLPGRQSAARQAGPQWRDGMTRDRRRRGVAIVWVAFLLFAVVLLMGMALDAARMYMDAHQLQNAADAAALAAAQYVKMGYLDAKDPDPSNQFTYPEVVYETGQKFAREHAALRQAVELHVADMTAYNATADVVIGYYVLQTRTFTPHDPEDPNSKTPNAVKVVARQVTNWDGAGTNRAMPLIFGRIAGVDHANVVRVAIAISKGTTGAGLICLLEEPRMPHPQNKGQEIPGLDLGGTPDIIVDGGDVQDNSQWTYELDGEYACEGSNNVTLGCDELNINGQKNPGAFWDTVEYNVYDDTGDVLPDPLRHLPALWDNRMQVAPPPADPGIVP
ncbi:MAG: pilus assembly protein TadG-related protein, partial [Planctomycetota bacterium]